MFLNADNNLFLRERDLDNICRIFDHIYTGSTYYFGRNHIFFLYCHIVASEGHVDIWPQWRDYLLRVMNRLELLAAPGLLGNGDDDEDDD